GVSPTSSIPDGTRASGAELPVELTAFHAAFSGSAMKGVDLMWTTASEFNNDYFEIEKSYDGADFEYVTRTKGAGTTNSTQEYTAYDPEMPTTTVYYRLKQTDYDGKYSLSSIFALNPQKTGSGCDLTVKPNPCIGRCIVSIENCPDANFENAVINVYDALGNVVYSSMPEVIEEGSAAFALDATNGFKPSVYFIRGSAGNNVMNKKIVIKN
ncbi:MAG: T9SS type A sorting domain-containing protein, partial [Bacteroidetes bacterium]|nr:T9SS type A sorting domain-containing protein [Bacteroidota bacterium]